MHTACYACPVLRPILEYFNKHYFSEQAFLNSTKLFPDFRAGNLILNSKVTTQQVRKRKPYWQQAGKVG